MKREHSDGSVVAFCQSRIHVVTFGDEGDETANLNTGTPAQKFRDLIFVQMRQEMSPFLWLKGSNFEWKDPIAGPIQVCAAFPQESWAVVLTPGNMKEMVQHTIEKQCKQTGNTIIEYRRASILYRLRQAVLGAGYQMTEDENKRTDESLDAAVEAGLTFLTRTTHTDTIKTFVTTLKRYAEGRHAANYITRAHRGVIDRTNIVSFLNINVSSEHLSIEQKNAANDIIRNLSEHHFAILVGAGGCGKTHVLKHLGIACQSTATTPMRIAFLAPTNKAVAVLSQKIGPLFQCVFGTIHSISQGFAESHNQFSLVVIDEASMLNDEHLSMLSNCSCFANAALLLVGDDLQLPPVGPGEVLRDVLLHYDAVRLTQNHRAQSSIGQILCGIREGHIEQLNATHVVVINDEKKRHEAIQSFEPTLTIAVRNYEKAAYNIFRVCQHSISPQLLRFDDFRKDDPHSTYLRSFVPYVSLPIVITSNTFKLQGGYRGRTGSVVSSNRQRNTNEVVVRLDSLNDSSRQLSNDNEGGVQNIVIEGQFWQLSKNMTVGYAVTVHSAQSVGSPRVAILLPPSSKCPLLTLEMLYTALSRASETFKIFVHSQDVWTESISQFSQQSPKRQTVLDILIDRTQRG